MEGGTLLSPQPWTSAFRRVLCPFTDEVPGAKRAGEGLGSHVLSLGFAQTKKYSRGGLCYGEG